jgi:hypothetical protein
MVFPNRLLSLQVTYDPRTLQIRNVDIGGTTAVMGNAVARRKLLKLLVDCPHTAGVNTGVVGEGNTSCSACDTFVPRLEEDQFEPNRHSDALQTPATFNLDQDERSNTEANVDADSSITEAEPNTAWKDHKLPVIFPELRVATAEEVVVDEMLDLFRKLVVGESLRSIPIF